MEAFFATRVVHEAKKIPQLHAHEHVTCGPGFPLRSWRVGLLVVAERNGVFSVRVGAGAVLVLLARPTVGVIKADVQDSDRDIAFCLRRVACLKSEQGYHMLQGLPSRSRGPWRLQQAVIQTSLVISTESDQAYSLTKIHHHHEVPRSHALTRDQSTSKNASSILSHPHGCYSLHVEYPSC